MRFVFRIFPLLALCALFNIPGPYGPIARAQDSIQPAPLPQPVETDGSTVQSDVLSEEQLTELLTRVDALYTDQDMMNLTVDVDLYRDPSGRLNSRNIRESNPSRTAGLSTIVSHYAYKAPSWYRLTVMGEVLAGSDLPADRTFYSQLLPMPGAPIFTSDIRSRFTIRSEGMDDVDGVQAYKIRYVAKDYDTEFFNYIVYYIEPERKVILRVESSFDNYYYQGIGEGDFFYDKWLGKFLPIYGHGSVIFYPDRRMNVWGRWYKWKWQTAEELAELESRKELPR